MEVYLIQNLYEGSVQLFSDYHIAKDNFSTELLDTSSGYANEDEMHKLYEINYFEDFLDMYARDDFNPCALVDLEDVLRDVDDSYESVTLLGTVKWVIDEGATEEYIKRCKESGVEQEHDYVLKAMEYTY